MQAFVRITVFLYVPLFACYVTTIQQAFIKALAQAGELGCRAEYKVYQDAEHGFFYDVTRRRQKEAFMDMLKFVESL